MEFTELADYPLPSGHLTEWIPTTGDDETCWAVDDRPLTYDHESHYIRGAGDMAEPETPNSWLGAVFEIHHPYDRDAVQRTLRSWMLRHEAFRTTVSESVDIEGNPCLIRRTNSGEVLQVIPHEVGELRTGTRVHQHLIEAFDTRISPLRWPHCLVATVTGVAVDAEQNRFVLVFGADHSIMDAYSMLLAISEIQRLYAAEIHGTDPGLPVIGSHVDFSVADRVIGGRMTSDHNVVTTWNRFLGVNGGVFPPFCLPVAPQTPAIPPNTIQNGTSSWLMSTAQADAINAHCRQLGYTMQVAVLASLALAARELSGENILRFIMPMHTRHESQYAESVGWYVGIIPIELDITDAESFTECLAVADNAVSATKNFSRFPFPRIAQLLGHESAPRFVVSYLDVRFVPGAEDWERWRARTLRSSAYSGDEVYMWIARTPSGVSISARFPGNNVATTNVHRLIDALGEVLDLVAQNAAEVAGRSGTGQAATSALDSFTSAGSRDKFPA